MSGATKRAMFTINNPTFKDSEKLYQLGHSENTKYLVYGCEHDDGKPDHTPHYQGFIIFKHAVRCNTVCALLGGRAYVCFPKRTDPSLRMARYCQKEGFYMQFGSLSIAPGVDSSIKPSEMRQKAIEWLNNSDNLYTRMRDIPPDLLMTPGFITAWTARRNTLCGPDRELKIITVIGPTACGKSYAAHNLLPDSAKCFYGNNGCWFSNADAPSLLIEEFNGQIPLQKLLTILDHYPFQLETKGGFAPALYTTVVITSNVTPDHWYSNFVKQGKQAEEAMRLGISLDEAEKKWNEAKKALFDRLGFRSNHRGCGYYCEWALSGLASPEEETIQMRSEIFSWMHACLFPQEHEDEQPHDFDEDIAIPASQRPRMLPDDEELNVPSSYEEQWMEPP